VRTDCAELSRKNRTHGARKIAKPDWEHGEAGDEDAKEKQVTRRRSTQRGMFTVEQ
jgi:hypothetical protein